MLEFSGKTASLLKSEEQHYIKAVNQLVFNVQSTKQVLSGFKGMNLSHHHTTVKHVSRKATLD